MFIFTSVNTWIVCDTLWDNTAGLREKVIGDFVLFPLLLEGSCLELSGFACGTCNRSLGNIYDIGSPQCWEVFDSR